MANVFEVGRKAECAVSIDNGGGLSGSGVYIPAGAIITGLRSIVPAAATVAGANATFRPQVGNIVIGTVTAVSDLAVSVPSLDAMLTTTGIYIGTSGEVQISCQASAGAAATATVNYYVDYIIPAT